MKKMTALVCVLSALALAACGRDEAKPQVQAEVPAGADTMPADMLLKQEPAGAVAISDLRDKATAGDEIVFRGFVGGQKKPFIDSRAVMVVVDAGMPNQCTATKDHCPTPWDYCCANKKELMRNMAMVQVTGSDGKAIKADWRSLAGVKENAEVIVRGVVSKKDANTFIVNATGVYVKGG